MVNMSTFTAMRKSVTPVHTLLDGRESTVITLTFRSKLNGTGS